MKLTHEELQTAIMVTLQEIDERAEFDRKVVRDSHDRDMIRITAAARRRGVDLLAEELRRRGLVEDPR